MQYLGAISKMTMISVCFQGKPFNITVIQVWDFPGDSVVNSIPAKQEIWVQSLGWEDPLEKEITAHSTILA